MTFLKELRDAAQACSNLDYRHQLRWAADGLEMQIAVLQRCHTRDIMIGLNSLWSHAERILKNVPAEADPNAPLAGAPEPARLAA